MSYTTKRFWSKVDRTDDCWWWTAAVNRGGYGVFRFSNRMVLAHRFVLGAVNSPLCVMHSCDNPGCVRPSHLSLGTQADNVTDMANKGRSKGRFSYATHCINGHAFDEVNTRIHSRGRICRTCHREVQRRYLERSAS